MNKLEIATSTGSFTGHLALPTGTPKGCVVVVQEIYGVNREVRRVTDWLAGAGFAAVAPDLLWRVQPDLDFDYADRDNARKAVSSLKPDTTADDIAAAGEALMKKAGNAGCAILSLGWGGRFAFMAAPKANARAVVAFYPGNLEGAIQLASGALMPQQFHFAKADERTKPEFRKALREAMVERDDVEIFVYQDADHGFANRDRAEFHEASAKLADDRTVEFLARILKSA